MNIFAYDWQPVQSKSLPVGSSRSFAHGVHTNNLVQRHSAPDFAVKAVACMLHIHLISYGLYWTSMRIHCNGQNHE